MAVKPRLILQEKDESSSEEEEGTRQRANTITE